MKISKEILKQFVSYIDLYDVYQFVEEERVNWFIENKLLILLYEFCLIILYKKGGVLQMNENEKKSVILADEIFCNMAKYFQEHPEELSRCAEKAEKIEN